MATYHGVESHAREWRPKQLWKVGLSCLLAVACVEAELVGLAQWSWSGSQDTFNALAPCPPDDGFEIARATPVVPDTSPYACFERYESYHHPLLTTNDPSAVPCLTPVPLSYKMLKAKQEEDDSADFFLSSTVALPQDFDDRFMSVRCWLSEDRVKGHLTDIAWDDLDNGCLSVDRGDNGKQRAIFAFGDSHAARFSVPLTVIAARAGMPLGWVFTDRPQLSRSAIMAIVRKLNSTLLPGDIVIHTKRVLEPSQPFQDLGPDAMPLVERMEALLPCVAAAGATIVVIGDNPTLPVDPSSCLPTALKPNALEACQTELEMPSTPEAPSAAKQEAEFAQWALQYAPLLRFMSARELWCIGSVCQAAVPGRNDTMGYVDQGHLSVAGALYLWPHIAGALSGWGLL
jgi:hypothetical protein